MAWFVGQSLLIVLAAFLLGLLVGWLVWGSRKWSPSASRAGIAAAPERNNRPVVTPRDPETRIEETRVREARYETVSRDVRAMDPVAATPVEPDDIRHDDLERIEGIGPKMAAALNAAGIHSFSRLAATDDDTRRAAIEAAGLTFAPSLVTWARQARLLADGDEEGFAELTERLIAGRDTERV